MVSSADFDHEIAEGIDFDEIAGMHDCRRSILLDHHRPGDAVVGGIPAPP